jgi:GTP 3',8-cyclase
VTDRCDFRCAYCMSENRSFPGTAEIVARGVRKLRPTGGQPLVRRGIVTLVDALSRHPHSGELDEEILATNGSRLEKARSLKNFHAILLRRAFTA